MGYYQFVFFTRNATHQPNSPADDPCSAHVTLGDAIELKVMRCRSKLIRWVSE